MMFSQHKPHHYHLSALASKWLSLQDRRAFLQYAAKGCLRFDLNRPSWALESEVRQLGGLIYW